MNFCKLNTTEILQKAFREDNEKIVSEELIRFFKHKITVLLKSSESI